MSQSSKQNGLRKRIEILEAGGGGAPNSASYLTLGTDATLTSERVLTAGTNISFVDAGAGSTLTINATGGSYTDEEAQDAVGTILVDSPSVDFTYSDATPSITATVKWTETEIDFGSTPNTNKNTTVTDANVSGSSKIIVVPSGNAATGRVGNDYEWDSIIFSAVAGTGGFILSALATFACVGKRKVFYQVI